MLYRHSSLPISSPPLPISWPIINIYRLSDCRLDVDYPNHSPHTTRLYSPADPDKARRELSFSVRKGIFKWKCQSVIELTKLPHFFHIQTCFIIRRKKLTKKPRRLEFFFEKMKKFYFFCFRFENSISVHGFLAREGHIQKAGFICQIIRYFVYRRK